MKKIAVAVAVALWVSSCGYVADQRTYEGGSVGALGGAVAGALIDKENRWRGAVIGGALGAVIGGTITDIATRASREAARHGKPVEYRSEDGKERVYAEPIAEKGGCKIVKTTYYQGGKIVRVEERVLCS